MTKKVRDARGITLVALVITVIIIIILAMITLSFIFGEDGIIARAEQAKLESEVARVREELEMAEATANIDGKGHIDMDHYWEILEDEDIIGSKDTDVSDDDGDGTYEVITDEGFIFDITPLPDEENTTDIVIDYVGTAEGPRISKIEVTEMTSNSVTIKVTATNANKGTYTYEYRKVGEESWTPVEGQEDTCKIEGLEQGQIYEVRVTVETNQGTASKTTEVKAGELTDAPIEFSMPTWNGGKASITVSTTAGAEYKLQYQIGGKEEGKWTEIANGGTITSNSIGVSVTATDGESGIASSLTYTYYIKQSSEADAAYVAPNGASNITANTYTFTGLTQGTSYSIKVEVFDGAGNKQESTTSVSTSKKPATNPSELKQGEYVRYSSMWGGNLLCAVLYDSSSPYGVEIISMTNVENLTLGNGTGRTSMNEEAAAFNTALNSYNNAISTLNEEVQRYNNDTYSTRVRCVGSMPDNPLYDGAGMYTNSYSWFSSYNGRFKNADENYVSDFNQMIALGIEDIGEDEEYWLASRYVGEYIRAPYPEGIIVRVGGEVRIGGDSWYGNGKWNLGLEDLAVKSDPSYDNGYRAYDLYSYDRTCGLRPVFKLKDTIRITGGSGTQLDPYILGV